VQGGYIRVHKRGPTVQQWTNYSQRKNTTSRCKEEEQVTSWRRERDSNPRYGFPYIGFQDRLFQPLTHPSAPKKEA
jgi:hypothetical protein